MLRNLVVCIAFLASGPLYAEDLALIIGNENYTNAADIPAAGDVVEAADALTGAGFTTLLGRDTPSGEMRKLIARYYADLNAAERTVIVLSGHFAHAQSRNWFFSTKIEQPDLPWADVSGFPLDTLMLMAAEKPGGAIVLLGTEDRPIPLGRGLTPGIGDMDIPEGVAVFHGDATRIAEFATEVVTLRGQSIAQMAARRGNLTAVGSIDNRSVFRPLPAPVWRPWGGRDDRDERRAEGRLWVSALAAGTRQGYEAYLQNYPNGRFAESARRAIAEIAPDPAEIARQAEAALNLSRDQRRQIQRDLAILDIDPRGIDGLFGRGSRAAIATWQNRNNHDATGFVTADQINQLSAQAARRAAELELEAERRQAEQDRLDRLYWGDTGAGRDEAGLRAYLRRYPDGLFSDVATDRLAEIEAARRGTVTVDERQAWQRALRANTVDGFQNYLAKYPNGAFADEARKLIDELSVDPAAEQARLAAERAEAALNMNPLIRSLVEQRLAKLGLNPGPTDGIFDDNTRQAVRRYQQARNLPVTGYLSQQTLVRLLADSL